ncbi:hypothetical protein HDV00_010390 [Rhizophlyctis rosea]|nr:hypothetical protein HDV00_010390 [Rhizophlyctis rosea]
MVVLGGELAYRQDRFPPRPRTTTILTLPAETLWRIFTTLDSPKYICKTLPHTCRTFKQIINSRSITIQANVELRSEEDEELGAYSALIQPPGPPKLLDRFRRTVVPQQPPAVESHEGGSGLEYTPVTPTSPSKEIVPHTHTPDSTIPSPTRRIVHIVAERDIRVHLGAITDNPHSLVNYLTDLVKCGLDPIGLGSSGGIKRNIRVVFGTVEVKGRRGRCPAELLGEFLGAMRPLNITLWYWDTDLIRAIPGNAAAPMLRLPNMKSDSHVKRSDLTLLSTLTSLERLELFRPLPRQPWGLEGSAFSSLSHLPNLRELVIRTGRLIGGQEPLTNALLTLTHLQTLELPWNIDARLGTMLLQGLPELRCLQFVNVGRLLVLPPLLHPPSLALLLPPPTHPLLSPTSLQTSFL